MSAIALGSRPTSLAGRLAALLLARPYLVVLSLTLLMVGLAHGINMAAYPYYENDEGAYISQAWSLIHEGRLAPYTYWYDHAPGGWIQIASWMLLTGGFHTMGDSVATARVLMLVLQLLSTTLVFRIAARTSGRAWVGALAALAFGLSAFGIYYHRRVLLDNITTFWMLLAIDLLLASRLSLYRVWASALALAVSILSKELTVFLVLAMAALVAIRSDPRLRAMALVTWASVGGMIVSLYPLFATLKGELFPTGSRLGGTGRHVSLLCSVSYQSSRGQDGGIFNQNSLFWFFARNWAHNEPLLVVGGSAAMLVCVLAIRHRTTVGVLGLLGLSLWVFLARGGVVYGFYLMPLLPLLAICLALAAWLALERLSTGWRVGGAAVGFVVVASGLAAGYLQGDPQAAPANIWGSKQSLAQVEAMDWVVANVPSGSGIIVDDALWTDFHDGSLGRDYQLAHWHWKVDRDPAIHDDVFHGDWRRVDYVIESPQMTSDVDRGHLTLVSDVLAHSRPIETFDTGGWKIQVRKVDQSGRLYAPPSSSTAGTTTVQTNLASPCESQSRGL